MRHACIPPCDITAVLLILLPKREKNPILQ